jgi:ethanolamine utilization protein EutN
MFLGRILGSVVATVKAPNLRGVPLLVMQPVDEELQPVGEPIVVADSIGVGRGEIVYWEGGREAPLALEESFAPVDATVVGIVDSLGKVPRATRRRKR